MATDAATVKAHLEETLPKTIEGYNRPFQGGTLRRLQARGGTTPRTRMGAPNLNQTAKEQKRSINASIQGLVARLKREPWDINPSFPPIRTLQVSLDGAYGGRIRSSRSESVMPVLTLSLTEPGRAVLKVLIKDPSKGVSWIQQLCRVSLARYHGEGRNIGTLSLPFHTFLDYRDGIIERLRKTNGNYEKLLQKQERILVRLKQAIDFAFSPESSSYFQISDLSARSEIKFLQNNLEQHFQEMSKTAKTSLDCHPSARTFLTLELMGSQLLPWGLSNQIVGLEHARIAKYLINHDDWKVRTLPYLLHTEGITKTNLKIVP